MLDLAGLDDVSAILLMAVLAAVVPLLVGAAEGALLPRIAETALWLILKLAALIAACVLFARYLEAPLTDLVERIGPGTDTPFFIIGVGMAVAAVAVGLGFSLAIGALLAGLAFSRDPRTVRLDAGLGPIHDLFAPFFFIGIGLQLDSSALATAVGLGAVLLAVGAGAKFVGTVLPALRVTDRRGAVLIGVSMVPRAEIALVIMEIGMSFGPAVVSPGLFGAVVLVSAASCLGAPLILAPLLERWPQTAEKEGAG